MHTSRSAQVDRALFLFLTLLFGCFFFEWGFAAIQHFHLHARFPLTTPLFNPAERFRDWTDLLPRARQFGSPGLLLRQDLGIPFLYPVPCLYIVVLFTRLSPHTTTIFLLFTVATFVLATVLFSRHLQSLHAGWLFQAAVWATLLLGEPAQFLIDRGNMEVFLWLAIALGLVAFVRQKPYLAAIAFAIAACLKIYPALFLLLFLKRRQYAAFLAGTVLIGLLSAAAVAGLEPTFGKAVHEVEANGHWLREIVTTQAVVGLRYDHSIFALFEQALYSLQTKLHPALRGKPMQFTRSAAIYSILAPLFFAGAYLIRLRRLPLLNQFTSFAIFAVILPYFSYDYTLVHLYLVFAALLLFLLQDVRTGLSQLPRGTLRLLMICFALVIAPVTALSFERYGGQVRCLALLGLLIIFLRYPMPSTLFNDRCDAGLEAADRLAA